MNHESFNTFRPISNPTFISKSIEKVVATQLGHRIEDSNLNGIYQSAYKQYDCTERTALIKVQDDILRAIDNNSCSIMLLLDLSAAFATVDHQIRLHRRSYSDSYRFGIVDCAFQWFRSYLSDCYQTVILNSGVSSRSRASLRCSSG